METIILENPHSGYGWVLFAVDQYGQNQDKILEFNKFCLEIFIEYQTKTQITLEEWRDSCSSWEFPIEVVNNDKEQFLTNCILLAKKLGCYLFEYNDKPEGTYTKLYTPQDKIN